MTTSQDLVAWQARLEAIARTGLALTNNVYDRERFEHLLELAAEMADGASMWFPEGELPASVGARSNVAFKYVTPKVAVQAIAYNGAGELLLNLRSDSGEWFPPGGFVDVGLSLSEACVKEVKEETGIDIEVNQLVWITNDLAIPWAAQPTFTCFFLCRATGGDLTFAEHESFDVGFFARDALPEPRLGAGDWETICFEAIDAATAGLAIETHFDPPR